MNLKNHIEETKHEIDLTTDLKTKELGMNYLKGLENARIMMKNELKTLRNGYEDWINGHDIPDIHVYTAFSAIRDVIKDIDKIINE